MRYRIAESPHVVTLPRVNGSRFLHAVCATEQSHPIVYMSAAKQPWVPDSNLTFSESALHWLKFNSGQSYGKIVLVVGGCEPSKFQRALGTCYVDDGIPGTI